MLEHPTVGLDIESTIYIWSKLKERCRQGTSICSSRPIWRRSCNTVIGAGFFLAEK